MGRLATTSHAAPGKHPFPLEATMRRSITAVLATLLLLWVARADEPKPPMLTPEQKQQLESQAKKLFADGLKLYQSGNSAEALKLLMEELKLRRRLHGSVPHPDLATSLNAVGLLLHRT